MPQNPTVPLTAKQRQAIEGLLLHGDVSSAAKYAGVHRDTVHRRLKQTSFLAALREAEGQALDELTRILTRLGRTAAGTLAKAMTQETTPAATKVRAADAVLGHILKLREMVTIEERLAAVEAKVNQTT
jgi:hypothetical protein